MSKTKKTNESGEENEDWAVLPFDEAEDGARWAQLSAEMEELEKEIEAHEAVHGKILMEADFSRYVADDNALFIAKDDEVLEENPF